MKLNLYEIFIPAYFLHNYGNVKLRVAGRDEVVW